MKPPSLILASVSPRRNDLMSRAGLVFEIIPAHSEEKVFPGNPEKTVAYNAQLKATEISKNHPGALVIGADTIVYHGGILGKPKDLDEGRKMLQELAGRDHGVFSGISVAGLIPGKPITLVAESRVWFKPFDEKVIEDYFSRINPLDKAGAYAIQEHGNLIIDKITGSYSNVIGLPLEALAQILTEHPQPGISPQPLLELADQLTPPRGINCTDG